MPGPLNYTTKVSAQQSIGECQAMLANHGADAIATTYGGISLGIYRSPEHAERVAWRVVKDWLEAQLAIVAALPYLITPSGRALREDWRDQLALPAAGGAA